MIEKEIREYKQGNKTVQRINILKSDNMDNGIVAILTVDEYLDIVENTSKLENFVQKLNEEVKEVLEENKILKSQIKTQKHYDRLFNKFEKDKFKTMNELQKKQMRQVAEMYEQHNTQLKEVYVEFNKEIQRYYELNNAYSIAFNNIMKLGLLDLLKNKHKQIAKDNIKQLDTKKFIEYVPKE